MITSIYTRISDIKHNKYNKLLALVRQKTAELEALQEQKKQLDIELENLITAFPRQKKAVYDEYLEAEVNKNAFDKIGYKIMVLEHEISAHRLKITSQEELIETAEKDLEELHVKRKILLKTLEKYKILIEVDIQEQQAINEVQQDNEMEEFAKAQKRL